MNPKPDDFHNLDTVGEANIYRLQLEGMITQTIIEVKRTTNIMTDNLCKVYIILNIKSIIIIANDAYVCMFIATMSFITWEKNLKLPENETLYMKNVKRDFYMHKVQITYDELAEYFIFE